ncbi:dolichyl glycosyltransferase [Holotrichia oblita]|uniref:Dolichyl glycosyltransferase n=1 Tax=Holotrichia oblita TaxID=644536 RepID=A0ACB9SGW3_HOLOL|nr:dolichyl glycosyltransferase [Holotrichia oblita]
MKAIRETALCLFGVLVSVLLRICTSLHPHSGQATPPMYGDYEAQRHWMEITVNLPVKQWYHNSTDNDLMYWGLDYPPLTAYHMYLCGLIAKYLNPEYVQLFTSRGYESESHKLFMRYTVLIVDILIFFPAVILYFQCTKYQHLQHDVTGVKRKETNPNIRRISAHLCIILSLIYPGLILIDHGHFQYNCVSLGFAIFAVAFISKNKHILASIFFCLALNYKQMELYHAFPFFLYLLSSCVPKPGSGIFSGCFKFIKIGSAVIITFAIIWSPFLFDIKDIFQVLRRLFPVAHGVFEDKVSNVWCALNAAVKLKQRYCNEEMLRICMATTLTALLPSSIDLFVRPNIKKFVPALINSSLAFFLFSFQVHEKSILLVAVPVLLYLPNEPIMCFWFLAISTEVVDESDGCGGKFSCVIVSDKFEGKTLLQRHR